MAKTNYNKMSNKPKEEVKVNKPEVEVVAEAPKAEEPDIAVTETKTGVVVCKNFLNVRKGPSLSSEIAGTLPNGQEVVICDEEGDFYKIGNPDSNEFCMKKFISVK